jgi:hypothetical protein
MLTFTLHVQAKTEGLLAGGNVEARGYLAHHASFGSAAQREVKTTLLAANEDGEVAIGPYTLPPLDALRGDETITMKQYALSNFSGVPQIDAKESGHVVRTQPAGTIHLAVQDVLAAGARQQPLGADLVDSILEMHDATMAHMREPTHVTAAELAAIMQRATKARVTMRVELTRGDLPLAHTYSARLGECRALGDRPDGPLLFGSRRQMELMTAAETLLMASHSRYFFQSDTVDSATGQPRPPVYPIGPEKSNDNLHLVSYQSDYGWLPASYYLLNTASARPPAPGVDSKRLCAEHAIGDEGRAFAEAQYTAALVRVGMGPAAFTAAILRQHALPKTASHVLPEYVRALRVLAQVATSAANAAYYHSDIRYHANVADAPPPSMRRVFARDMATLRQRAGYGAGEAAGAAEEEKLPNDAEGVEDFWIGLHTGESTGDDCEGSGSFACEVQDENETMATVPQKFPLLAAASLVLAKRVPFMAASSVTSAFFNTDGSKMTRNDLKDLPLMGDAVDAKSGISGHAHGLWMPLPVVANMLERAGHSLARDLPALAAARDNAAAWEFAAPILVLEGTGASEPFVLPTQEVPGADAALVQQSAAARALYATIRDKAPAMVDAFRFEGINFYDTAQDRQRRVSTFYRGVAFLASRKLMQMNPLYGTLAVVNTRTRQRGIDIGALLRDAGLPTGGEHALGLVSPFALDPTVGRQTWDTLVTPLAACIQNQMPLSVYARFVPAGERAATLGAAAIVLAAASAAPPVNSAVPQRVTSATALLRMNHALPLRIMRSLERVPPSLFTTAFDRHGIGLALRGQASAPLALAASAGNADAAGAGAGATVTMFTQAWRVAMPGAMEKIEAELRQLQRMGAIRAFQFRRNRPLIQCPDVIDLILSL